MKLVWPQSEFHLSAMARTGEFTHRFLQPMDGPDRVANTALCIAECMRDPTWRLSVQTHKITGIR